MPNDPNSTLPDSIVQPATQPTVYSPSPTPGEPAPRRRTEDTATYTFEWVLLLVAVLTWSSSFLIELAQYDTWAELQSPKVLLPQLGQLMGTIAAVISAKRIR